MTMLVVRVMLACRCLVEEGLQFVRDKISPILRLFFENDEDVVADGQLRKLLIGLPKQPFGVVSLHGSGDSAFHAHSDTDARKLIRQRPEVELVSSNPAPVASDGEKSGGVSESFSSRV